MHIRFSHKWKMSQQGPTIGGGHGNWEDLVQFEVHPVITSAEAAERVASKRPA